ncbi:MAG: hypothetical protein KatS3mg061_2859 [Dehalococcoidia bacterium]|nr:MAG: hypothetical protein KatS3mg061_2859 [Dehalococcoidia bacterium]
MLDASAVARQPKVLRLQATTTTRMPARLIPVLTNPRARARFRSNQCTTAVEMLR